MLLLRSQLQGGARPESSERLPADEAYLQVWVQLEPRMMTWAGTPGRRGAAGLRRASHSSRLSKPDSNIRIPRSLGKSNETMQIELRAECLGEQVCCLGATVYVARWQITKS